MTLYDHRKKPKSVVAMAKDVYDVSGAGDTVIALTAAGAGAGCPMDLAVEIANLGAGVVVGRVGTYSITLPDLELATTGSHWRGQGSACPLSHAKKLVKYWRMQGQKIVFTNGCFDILHMGHITLLQQASRFGGKLIVGLNTDDSIRRLKGKERPILSEADRSALLAALDCVDLVVLFDDDTPLNIIETLRPDTLVKGGDYTPVTVVGGDIVESWGGQVEIVPLIDQRSTTAIVKKIQKFSTSET